ncbi:MAG: CAP domain-containing protein [Patescibacteria group bacterium]
MRKVLQKTAYHLKRHAHRGIRHVWDHFVPHEGNNHHPYLFKHKVLIGYSVLLILLKVLVIVAPIALPSSSLFSSAITSQNIIALTNQTRINLGLSELKPNDKLAIAAQAKAKDMLQNQYFAHTSPSGITPWNWIKDAGYIYRSAGENLAVYFFTAESVNDGWMASPTHKANIVNSSFSDIGIGITMGTFEGYDTTLVVQMFGTPLAVASQPANLVVATTPPSVPTLVNEPEVNTNNSANGQVEAAESVDQLFVTEPIKVVEEPLVINEPITEPEIVTEPETDQVVAEPKPENVVLDSGVVVNDASLKVQQLNNEYKIYLQIEKAKSAVVHLAEQTSNLELSGDNEWQGIIGFDSATLNKSGELLSITVVGQDDVVTNRPLAWLAPKVSTQNLYNFNEGNDKFAKFFGFITVHNLNDKVTQFYLYFVIFLVAALLLNIFIKIRIQKVSVIAHSAIVIALALLLIII